MRSFLANSIRARRYIWSATRPDIRLQPILRIAKTQNISCQNGRRPYKANMPIVKLTQAFIDNNLQCPSNKSRIEYCCQELPGLYVEIRATSQGQGTYYLRYKDSTGKTCHQKIARTTDISLQDARKRAKTLKAEIALGAPIHVPKNAPERLC